MARELNLSDWLHTLKLKSGKFTLHLKCKTSHNKTKTHGFIPFCIKEKGGLALFLLDIITGSIINRFFAVTEYLLSNRNDSLVLMLTYIPCVLGLKLLHSTQLKKKNTQNI